MKRAFSIVACVWFFYLTAGLSSSQEVKVPDKVNCEVGLPSEFKVSVPKDHKLVWAKGWSTNRCRLIRLWSDDSNEAIFEVTPYQVGDFVTIFWLVGPSNSTKYYSSRVVFSTIPPDPKPPDPKPPTPPDPKPGPVGELAKKLKASIDSDTAPAAAKRGYVLSLSGFYAGVAESEWLQKGDIQDLGTLLVGLREERKKFCPEDVMIGARKVISEHLLKALGDDPAVRMTDALRATTKAVFVDISKALMEVQ